MSGEVTPLIQIVDANDMPLHGGTMDEAQLQGLWHRLARVMVRDASTGMYLLQMVAKNPFYDGGLWNTTASGHVDNGETYEQAARRETSEEMGLELPEGSLIEVERYTSKQTKNGGRHYLRHNVTFLAVFDQTPELAPNDEVELYKWVTLGELLGFDRTLATSGLLHYIDSLRSSHGN